MNPVEKRLGLDYKYKIEQNWASLLSNHSNKPDHCGAMVGTDGSVWISLFSHFMCRL